MRILAYLLLSSLLQACSTSGISQSQNGSGYEITKASLLKSRATLQTAFRRDPKATIVKAHTHLFHAVVDSLAPHWYGTAWDYNGITPAPGEGYIACGYFVTTLLRDAGLPVARVRLAQAPASMLIREVCAVGSVHRFSSLQKLQAHLAAAPDESLFILGLDNHVGFIIKEAGTLYFLDAGYLPPQQVAKVLLEESAPVGMSRMLMVGDMLGNDALLHKWLASGGDPQT